MDTTEKLQLVGGQMDLEPAEESEARAWQPAACGHSPAGLQQAVAGTPAGTLSTRQQEALGVYEAVAGGRRVKLLKTLLTSACERDCYYCPFRARRNYRRATFKPEEMARAFSEMQRAGIAEGLFLSSGIAGGGLRTQDRLIDTAELVRRRHGFRGYLHLKLMPGAERDQVLRAMQLADRVSINLEAPNAARLARLAPHKGFLSELLKPLEWAAEIRRTLPPRGTATGRWPSLVTQFVVGAAGESDLELLLTSSQLIRRLGLRRTYFSAFRPLEDTPLENLPAENPWREHRLYQSSFLLRDYGFDVEELPFGPDGRLPLESDPKLAWARQTLGAAPIELNRASRETLLRVPGIGPRGADAILRACRRGTLRELRDLERLGITARRAAPFILLAGQRPAFQPALL
jgi:predicted DNA-binding helix-hairpin-helix protein